MQERIVVSILCITYNQKEYIKSALEGFIHQKTDFAFEVIVHDDASTDGTTEIIKEYAKKVSCTHTTAVRRGKSIFKGE